MKKKNIVLILILLILAIVAAAIYFMVLKKTDSKKLPNEPLVTPVPDNVNAEDVVQGLFEKSANFLQYSECKQHSTEAAYCYFDKYNSFKNKFYNIYSSKLNINDVLFNYDFETKELSKNEELEKAKENSVYRYGVMGDDVYVDTCLIEGDYFERIENIKINSKSDTTIEASYVIVLSSIVNEKDVHKVEGKMKLVKENNDWHIASGTIIGKCNFTYNIGK